MSSYGIEPGFEPESPHLARIGLDNALERALTLTSTWVGDGSSNENPSFPVSNVVLRDTYSTWRPTTWSPRITATWALPVTVNYFAIARHNLGSGNLSAQLDVKPPGGDWTKVAGIYPEHDGTIVIPFAETQIEEARLSIGTGASAVVAVVQLGRAVIVPRPLRASTSPVFLSRRTRVVPQMSEGGQLLGSIVTSRGVEVSPEWRNLPRAFYDGTLRALAHELPGTPIAFLWQPEEHPDEAVYGIVDGDVEGGQAGGNDRYSFGFTLRGLGPGAIVRATAPGLVEAGILLESGGQLLLEDGGALLLEI